MAAFCNAERIRAFLFSSTTPLSWSEFNPMMMSRRTAAVADDLSAPSALSATRRSSCGAILYASAMSDAVEPSPAPDAARAFIALMRSSDNWFCSVLFLGDALIPIARASLETVILDCAGASERNSSSSARIMRGGVSSLISSETAALGSSSTRGRLRFAWSRTLFEYQPSLAKKSGANPTGERILSSERIHP